MVQESSAEMLHLICSEIVLFAQFPSWVASGTKGQVIWTNCPWLIQDQSTSFAWLHFFPPPTLLKDHWTFGIQSPISAIGSDNWKQQNTPQEISSGQIAVDQLRAEKRLEVEKGVLQSTQAKEARRSSRWNVCFLNGHGTGGQGVCPWCQGKV